MQELSIFVDESGDAGEVSDYYLLVLVLHDQASPLHPYLEPYNNALVQKGLKNIPMHLGPLLQGHDAYEYMDVDIRKKYLYSFAVFAEKAPISYAVFSYKKKQLGNSKAKLMDRMKRDLINFLFDQFEFFQSFDVIKVYYDNGQPVVTNALHDAIEYALCKNAIIYKDAKPADYRLLQLTDYICGLELTALKYADNDARTTDLRFFGEGGTFKKNYLKKIRRKRPSTP